jgi:hypothetical protein
MAQRVYIVRFALDPSIEVGHRVRNFAEDVFRALRDEGLGTVPNMDTAQTEVRIEVAATRHLGRVRDAIKRQRFTPAIGQETDPCRTRSR